MSSRGGMIRNAVGAIRNVCVTGGGSGTQITKSLLGGSRNYHHGIYSSMLKGSCGRLWTCGDSNVFCSTVVVQQPIFWSHQRMVTTQTKVPAQARHKGTQLSMQSPGFIIEPYTRREPIAFWRRCFTRSGWRRTKEDVILELKSAYAISKLRKKGYSKQKFYTEAFNLYKEINSQIATRDKASLRKAVTENMYSTLKNEIKQRQSVWSSVYLELIEPAVKIRTLRARMIALDKDDLRKFFIQLTLEFLTKQKFEAYDSSGSIVAGDKDKEDLNSGKMIGNAKQVGGLYFLENGNISERLSQKTCFNSGLFTTNDNVMLWHYRLGHPSFHYMRHLFPKFFMNKDPSTFDCEICQLAKHHRNPFPSQPYKATRPFTIIHSDVWGPSKIKR
ncbi:uncharacterized protein LOC141693694 isoform X2 [Apium graveolens]|uniref:uncharacterized protein LOC141693694 isoform X2 n=1 Tax=Apium graveolens TaxID=4045 RepID=UPI003D796BE5